MKGESVLYLVLLLIYLHYNIIAKINLTEAPNKHEDVKTKKISWSKKKKKQQSVLTVKWMKWTELIHLSNKTDLIKWKCVLYICYVPWIQINDGESFSLHYRFFWRMLFALHCYSVLIYLLNLNVLNAVYLVDLLQNGMRKKKW